jgi:hypothetical protein
METETVAGCANSGVDSAAVTWSRAAQEGVLSGASLAFPLSLRQTTGLTLS